MGVTDKITVDAVGQEIKVGAIVIFASKVYGDVGIGFRRIIEISPLGYEVKTHNNRWAYANRMIVVGQCPPDDGKTYSLTNIEAIALKNME